MSDNFPDKPGFLYPRSRYYGKFTPQQLAFNANLQEFAQKVGYICSLETGGKISPNDAYQQICRLWKELQASREGLGIDDGNPEGSVESNPTP